MKRCKQRWRGVLLFLLLIVGVPGLLLGRARRQERLSVQLIAVLKHAQSATETSYDPEENKNGQQRESLKWQTQSDEAKVLRLLEEGADPNRRDFAVVKRTFWEELKFLLKRTFKPHSASALPPSALAIAVHADDAVMVKALLAAGANDVNTEIEQFEERFPLVNYGAYCGNREIVQALIAHGADIHRLGYNDNPTGEPILVDALAAADLDDMICVNKARSLTGSQERAERTELFHQDPPGTWRGPEVVPL